MNIHVGSKNPTKVEAVQEIIEDYPLLKGSSVEGMSTSSGVSDQPKSMEETVQGAINRAKNCFTGADLSFGIESGIILVPQTKTGYMDVCVCAIYDGKEVHLGTSSQFEYPKKIMELVLEGGHEVSDAAKELGISPKKRLGDEEGMIGVLTKGRLVRKDYTKEALRTALIHLENPDLY